MAETYFFFVETTKIFLNENYKFALQMFIYDKIKTYMRANYE